MITIPVILMFNDNYSMPAAVALYSMLNHAQSDVKFDIRVMHTNISNKNIAMLNDTVKEFSNTTLTFIAMDEIDKQLNIPEKIAGWPKEVIYKLLVAEIFPDLNRAIITDVDVVFLGDIVDEFIKFDSDEYFAGVKQSAMQQHTPFSTDITDNNMHFICGAGYMIYNLTKMRADNMPTKYMRFMHENQQYLKLPDQEILNIVSWPKIKLLHPRNMVLVTYYAENDYLFNKFDYTSTETEHQQAKKNPIQLHFVGYKTWGKPWNDFNAPCANIWFRYLTYTPYFVPFMACVRASRTLRCNAFYTILGRIAPLKRWRRKIRKMSHSAIVA